MQHFAAYADRQTVLELAEGARRFATELVRAELGLDLDDVRGTSRAKPSEVRIKEELVEPAEELQRDASFGGGVLVWAQGRAGSSMLGIRARGGDRVTRWLTPEDEFEYMPHTDGSHVVAYRQSGGIVLYDIASGQRTVISESGGPGDIERGVVAAQGIGIAGGLGGGVWLVRLGGGDEEVVAQEGDSPRLSDDRLVWQELRGGAMTIRMRPRDGKNVTDLVSNATHPSIDGSLVAWNESSGRPSIWATDLDSGERLRVAEAGIFPDVRGSRIAFLSHRDDSYGVCVFDFRARQTILQIEDVGFPMGRGPILAEREVVWESGRDRGVNQLYFSPLP